MEAGGKRYVLKRTPDGYVAVGPITCREAGELHTSWQPSQTCPDSVDLAQWSANGTPAPNNAPGFLDPLPVHPVLRAWDGTLLADLEISRVSRQGTSPVPSLSPTP